MPPAWREKWLGLKVTSPKITALIVSAEDFASRFFLNDHSGPVMLVIVGDPGIGKTHVAKSLHRWAMHVRFTAWETLNKKGVPHWKNVPVLEMVSWPEITDGMKGGAYEVIEDLVNADLLIIDDAGAEQDPSQNGTNKFCQILSRRENKFTVVTTNVSPGQWHDRFDLRIADRLLRHNSIIVDLSGEESFATWTEPKGA